MKVDPNTGLVTSDPILFAMGGCYPGKITKKRLLGQPVESISLVSQLFTAYNLFDCILQSLYGNLGFSKNLGLLEKLNQVQKPSKKVSYEMEYG